MDNVGHTLIGVALARSAFDPKKDLKKFKVAALSSVIGSNLPDLDYVWEFLFGDKLNPKLGSLLQHRGLSHSLLLSFPLGLLAGFIAARVFKVSQSWKWVFIGWVSVLVHTLVDFSNEYGVHPFSPFWNRWFYGDFLFIVEPLIWFSLLPLAINLFSFSKWAYVGGVALTLLMLGLVWVGPFVAWQAALWVTLWAIVHFLFQRKWHSPVPALGGAGVVVFLFLINSYYVKIQMDRFLDQNILEEERLQVLTSPAPAHPFCWKVIVSTLRGGEDYLVRLGTFSVFPDVFDPKNCHFNSQVGIRTAPLQKIDFPFHSSFAWVGQFQSKWHELIQERKKNCQWEAFLRFSRIPFWVKTENGLLFGDLRYDRGPELGFAEFQTVQVPMCSTVSHSLSQWLPPILANRRFAEYE